MRCLKSGFEGRGRGVGARSACSGMRMMLFLGDEMEDVEEREQQETIDAKEAMQR